MCKWDSSGLQQQVRPGSMQCCKDTPIQDEPCLLLSLSANSLQLQLEA
jgi:hypothetical protein